MCLHISYPHFWAVAFGQQLFSLNYETEGVNLVTSLYLWLFMEPMHVLQWNK